MKNLRFGLLLLLLPTLLMAEDLPDTEVHDLLQQVMENHDPAARTRLLEAKAGHHPLLVETVDSLVERFREAAYADRQLATQRLFWLGELSIPALERHRHDGNPEVEKRVAELVDPPVNLWPYEWLLLQLARMIEKDPVRTDLIVLREVVDHALGLADGEKLKERREALSVAQGRLTRQQRFFSEPKPDLYEDCALAEEALIQLLTPNLRPFVVDQPKNGERTLQMNKRKYRLRINEWSFVLQPQSEPTEHRLRDWVPRAQIANGRPIRDRTPGGEVIHENQTFTLQPHNTWIIGESLALDGRRVRYYVHGSSGGEPFGVTTTGDALDVAEYLVVNLLGMKFYELGQVTEYLRTQRWVENYLR